MRTGNSHPRLLDLLAPQRGSDRNADLRFCIRSRLDRASLCLIFFLFLFNGSRAWTQSPASTTSGTPTSNAAAPQNPAPNPAQQKPDRVTTTVVVHGEVKDDYLSDDASAASFDNTPLSETPLSVTDV